MKADPSPKTIVVSAVNLLARSYEGSQIQS